MPLGAAEALVLAGVVALLFWLLRPLRRRLELWIARRVTRTRTRRSGRVVVLQRRRDGTFGREEDRDGR
jgi:hypothetical protein